MPTRFANAVWKGDLKKGKGAVTVESGTLDAPYSFSSRFETGKGTNPEELIGAALAGCFSMFLASELAKAGHDPESVSTKADVILDMSDGPHIIAINLISTAEVPGVEKAEFMKIAELSKKNCPASKALKSVKIELDITLKN